MTIGQRLKAVRKFNKLTQQQVASSLSITKQTLSRYETGERVPDVLLVQKFVQLYNIDSNWLINGVGEMFPETTGNSPENKTINQILKDREVLELMRAMEIPEIKRSILAEFDKLKVIFKTLVREIDKKGTNDEADSS